MSPVLSACDPGPSSMSARVGINGFGRMGRLALRAAWGWPELAFTHVNELHGDASTAAHLLTFDSIHGRWSEDVHGDGDVLDGQRDRRSATAAPPSPATCRGASSASRSCSSARAGSARRSSLDAILPAGRAQGDRRRSGQGGRAERGGRGQRPPLRTAAPPSADGRLLHDQLPCARGQGDPRGDRDPARADHDPARHDQHADADRCAAQGPAPGARRERLADPHHDRLGDRDRAHLPRAGGQAERPRRARAAAQRVADGLRVRGGPTHDRRGGQRPARGRRGRAAGGDPRIRATAARIGRLQGRPALGDRRRALHDGHGRDPGEDPRVVRQRVGLRQPPRRARAHGRGESPWQTSARVGSARAADG